MSSTKDRKPIEKRCRYCGLLFLTLNSRTKYCSEDCKKGARSLAQQKLRSVPLKAHTPRTADKSISEVMREVDEYNRTHKKSITYGQYVARMEEK